MPISSYFMLNSGGEISHINKDKIYYDVSVHWGVTVIGNTYLGPLAS